MFDETEKTEPSIADMTDDQILELVESGGGAASDESKDEGGTGETLIEIDGVKYTAQQIKEGMLRQADYTKKTQALAEERASLKADIDEIKALKGQFGGQGGGKFSGNDLAEILETIKNLGDEEKFDPDEPITGDKLDKYISKRLASVEKKYSAETEQLRTALRVSEETRLRDKIEGDLERGLEKYPHVDRLLAEAMIVKEIQARRMPNVSAIVRELAARKPSGHVSDEDKKRIIDEHEASKKINTPRPAPDTGKAANIPNLDFANMSWKDLDKVAERVLKAEAKKGK